MRAVEVKIHNFRSIHDVEINLKDVSLIAGANNAGKSNVIDAIRIFYGDLKWTDARDTPIVSGVDADSWIEIEFKPSPDELIQLKDEYKSADGTFRVRNYLKSAHPGPDGKVRAGYYAYVEGKLSDTLFYGAKNVGSAKVGKIVYVPAVSKLDEHTKLTGPSALRDLIASVMTKVVSGSSAYNELTVAFSAFETEIKKEESEDGESLHSLEGDISDQLNAWGADFQLGIQNIQPDEIIKSLIKPQLFDQSHGGEIDQSRFGAGFQRNLIYILIKLAAKYASSPKKKVVKKEFSPELNWILFEEPEAFLHPTQEDVLYDSLLALARDEDSQVLLSTHSSRFVSRTMDDLTRLVRLRRDGGVTTSFQVNDGQLAAFFDAAHAADAEITPALLDPSTIDANKMMNVLKMELWLQPQRATAFFAKWVVLVEGASEVGLYAYLISRGILPTTAQGVVIIDCMGKYNIHRFMQLLNAFGIDHAVLYDGDGGGAHDTEVTATILNATGAYTQKVKRLDRDLEFELGITPLARQDFHKKPQYILYNLEANLISNEGIEKAKEIFNEVCLA